MQTAVHDAIDRLFARQDGLATLAQLVELGLSRQVVRARLRRGPWRLVLPHVVSRDARSLDARQRLVAAYLMAGADAFISSWSAATWQGVEATASERRIVVAIPADRLVRSSGFVVV